jgi:hypothetical protein
MIDVDPTLTRYLRFVSRRQGPARPRLAEFFLAEDPDRRAHQRFIELHRAVHDVIAEIESETTRKGTIP